MILNSNPFLIKCLECVTDENCDGEMVRFQGECRKYIFEPGRLKFNVVFN